MREAHGVTRRVAHEHHTGHDDDGRDDCRTSHSHQFLETEVKSHGKQEEDNTDFRPGLDIRRIRYVRRQGKIGRGEEPGEDIPQYDRLVQFLEDKRDDAGDDQDQGQIRDERCCFRHDDIVFI